MRIIANENVAATVISRTSQARPRRALGQGDRCQKQQTQQSSPPLNRNSGLCSRTTKTSANWRFATDLPATCGVLLIRLSGAGRQADIEQVLNVIDSREDWAGQFSVASRGRLRMHRCQAQKASESQNRKYRVLMDDQVGGAARQKCGSCVRCKAASMSVPA